MTCLACAAEELGRPVVVEARDLQGNLCSKHAFQLAVASLKALNEKGLSAYEDQERPRERLIAIYESLDFCIRNFFEISMPAESREALMPDVIEAMSISIALQVRAGVRVCNCHGPECQDPIACARRSVHKTFSN